MTNEIIQRVRVVLRDSISLTMDNISHLISEAEAEQARLAATLDADRALMLNIETPEDQFPEIEARIVRSDMDRARLAGAVPRLHRLREEMAKAELATRQDKRYAEVKARCKAIQEQVDRAYDETIPQLAAALRDYRELQIEVEVFNAPATPQQLVNPQDRLVKRYRRISQPVPDAVLKGLQLVAKDGAVLYAHVDISRSGFRPTVSPTKKHVNFALEKEALMRAKEQQPHAQAILRGLEHEVEARGISLEHAAMNEGLSAKAVERYREQADGKHVEAAYAALRAAHKAFEENENATS
jgi:hypothetical protein